MGVEGIELFGFHGDPVAKALYYSQVRRYLQVAVRGGHWINNFGARAADES